MTNTSIFFHLYTAFSVSLYLLDRQIDICVHVRIWICVYLCIYIRMQRYICICRHGCTIHFTLSLTHSFFWFFSFHVFPLYFYLVLGIVCFNLFFHLHINLHVLEGLVNVFLIVPGKQIPQIPRVYVESPFLGHGSCSYNGHRSCKW